MSQVFFLYPHIDHSVVLLFKDSKRGRFTLRERFGAVKFPG